MGASYKFPILNHRQRGSFRPHSANVASKQLLTKGFSPKATGTKAGTNFSPQAIGTKVCTRLSGLGTVPISPRASGLISPFLLVIRS